MLSTASLRLASAQAGARQDAAGEVLSSTAPQATRAGAQAAVIELRNVSKIFSQPDGQRFRAVSPLSLRIPRGDVFGLIGRSGAGKSTLLRLINLLERPDTGSVIVDGRELTAMSKHELRLARQSIGMIFQQFNLLQNATVFDNVAFGLRIHGKLGADEIGSRVDECLRIVGLHEKARAYPAQLSGGQKQRVAIARALASRPTVLLCDEPTSALDAQTTRSLLATLRDINSTLGVTIVIVTHELDVVKSLCRNVAILEGGELIEQFPVNERDVDRVSEIGQELALILQADDARAPLSKGVASA